MSAQLLQHLSSVAFLGTRIDLPKLHSMGFGPHRRSRSSIMGPGVNLGKNRDSGQVGDIDNSTFLPNYCSACLPLSSSGPIATCQCLVRRDLAHLVAQGRLLRVPRSIWADFEIFEILSGLVIYRTRQVGPTTAALVFRRHPWDP